MKICPFCDGEIRDDTIKCWHCTMDLPPVKVAKQDMSEQKVPPLEDSKITKEPPPRPSPQQSTAIKICPFCNSEIQDNAIFCPHCSRSLPPIKVAKQYTQHTSEQKVPPLEVPKIAEEQSPRPSSQQRLVGKPQIKENKGGVKTWLIWVWICVSALILLLFASVFAVSIISQKANFGYPFVYAAIIIGDIAIIVILYSRINIEWEIKLQEIWNDYKGYFIISIMSISIIILLAGILFTIANLNKREEPVSVATPKVEASVAQPAPAPVPNQPAGPTSKEDLERIAKEKYFDAIRSAHPDFDNLRDSGIILAWIQKQPSHLRDSLLKTYNEGDADSVITLLNQYKKDKNSRRSHKDKVKIPKKYISVTNRPVNSERPYKAIEGLRGIELNDGNVIEGQIISFSGDTVKILTKDGKILTYSFIQDVKSFIF